MNRLFTFSAAVIGFGVLPGGLRPVAPQPRSFILVQKNDTASETFTRSADSLSGTMAFGKVHIRYEAKIAADGTIPRLDVRVTRDGAAAPAPKLVSVIVGRDSTQFIEQVGKKRESVRVAEPPGALPFINFSVGLTEILVARARAQQSRTARVPAIIAFDIDNLDKSPSPPLRSRAQAGQLVLTFLTADSVMVGTADAKDRLRVAVGTDGQIRGVVSGADAKDHFKAVAVSKPVAPHK